MNEYQRDDACAWLIRADGTTVERKSPMPMDQVRETIGADALDTVSLRSLGRPLRVMLLDDQGHAKRLPVNRVATELYHAQCVPGTTHEIRGDVVVTFDGLFA